METKTKFIDLIENSEQPVLVDFYADWCGPCKSLSPIIAEVAGEYSGRIKVIKVNVDRNPYVSNLYQIKGIPTMILFHKGQIIWRQEGAVPAQVIKKVLSQY
jgi:thioredoxin 1